MGLNSVVPIDLPLRETPKYFFQRDAPLQSREGRTKAKVNPIAEREVLPGLAMNVELMRVREMSLVPIGGGGQQ
jgi:hypothetical protein